MNPNMNMYGMYGPQPQQYGPPQYAPYPYPQSLQVTGCAADEYNLPVLNCVKKNYVYIGGAAILALFFLGRK